MTNDKNESIKMETKADNEDEVTFLRRQNSELRNLILKALQSKSLRFAALPLDLQEDRDFVMTAVQSGSLDWYTLIQKWKDDAEVACGFFKRNPVRMTCSKSQFIGLRTVGGKRIRWVDLPYHLLIDKEVLSHALRSQDGPDWKEIPRHFQTDEELLVVAATNGKISFEDVPEDLVHNRKEISLHYVRFGKVQVEDCPCLEVPFLRKTIEDNEFSWKKLPPTLQSDIHFARSISRFCDTELPGLMLQSAPELRLDKTFWRRVCYSEELGKEKFMQYSFKKLMEDYAPPEFYFDRDFMLEMCQECSEVFPLVGNNLANDRDFIDSALERNAAILRFLSHDVQQLHRDLVTKAVSNLSKCQDVAISINRTAYEAASAIFPGLWLDFEFAMTWVKAGLRIPIHALADNVRFAWYRDRRICLAHALHGPHLADSLPRVFSKDINFMREVIGHHPEFYLQAEGAAKADPRVKTVAFAGDQKLVKKIVLDLHLKGQDDKIEEYLAYLRKELSPFETFSSCILGNMLSTQSVEETGTNLTMLNQGLETSIQYKQLLAEYLDIPTGKWLCRLQQAERHVRGTIAPWTDQAYSAKYKRPLRDETQYSQAEHHAHEAMAPLDSQA